MKAQVIAESLSSSIRHSLHALNRHHGSSPREEHSTIPMISFVILFKVLKRVNNDPPVHLRERPWKPTRNHAWHWTTHMAELREPNLDVFGSVMKKNNTLSGIFAPVS
jgi:hypothetical protein